MSKGMRFRGEVIWSIGLVLLFLLPLIAACGDDEGSRARVTSRRTAPPPPEVTLPPEEETVATAVEEVEPIVVEPEEPREVTYEEAESVYFERRYDEATELFTLYTERRPQNPWGFYMLGLSAWKSGQHGLAEDALQRALERDPLHVKSWLNLARVQLDEGRVDEALLQVEEALAIEPESSVGYRLLGRAYGQLDRREEAIDAYRQAILIDSEDAWSMNNLGYLLIEDERFEEALPPLARAVELEPEISTFHNNLGVALERNGYFRAAEDAFRAVLALDDSYLKAEINLLRVETLEEDPTLLPVDLAELARSFVDEVEGWREAVAYREWPDWVELEEPAPIADPVVITGNEVALGDTLPLESQASDTTGVESSEAGDGESGAEGSGDEGEGSANGS